MAFVSVSCPYYVAFLSSPTCPASSLCHQAYRRPLKHTGALPAPTYSLPFLSGPTCPASCLCHQAYRRLLMDTGDLPAPTWSWYLSHTCDHGTSMLSFNASTNRFLSRSSYSSRLHMCISLRTTPTRGSLLLPFIVDVALWMCV